MWAYAFRALAARRNGKWLFLQAGERQKPVSGGEMDGSVKVSDSMLQRLKPRVAKARKTVKGKTSKSIVKAVESAGCMRLKRLLLRRGWTKNNSSDRPDHSKLPSTLFSSRLHRANYLRFNAKTDSVHIQLELNLQTNCVLPACLEGQTPAT